MRKKALSFRTFASKIDFPRLRRQKALLRALRQSLGYDTDDEPEARQREELEGIVNLLDDLMDNAALEFSEKKVFGKHSNTGCLAGLRCPKCGYEDHMYITAESEFTVTDDGTEDNCDVEWDEMSWVRCGDGECGHSGQMWEFQA